MLYPRSNLETGLCKISLNVLKYLLLVQAKKMSLLVFISAKTFSSSLYVYSFTHSFLLLSSFCHGLPRVSALHASGFSTSHLCNFLPLMTWVTCIWYMLCNLEISAPVFLSEICPSSHQGADVRYGNKGNKVKRNKCIEMKITSASTEIKLKKCNALNSVFSRKVNYILLTILTQVTFESKRSLNRIILKSGVLSCVWRVKNA